MLTLTLSSSFLRYFRWQTLKQPNFACASSAYSQIASQGRDSHLNTPGWPTPSATLSSFVCRRSAIENFLSIFFVLCPWVVFCPVKKKHSIAYLSPTCWKAVPCSPLWHPAGYPCSSPSWVFFLMGRMQDSRQASHDHLITPTPLQSYPTHLCLPLPCPALPGPFLITPAATRPFSTCIHLAFLLVVFFVVVSCVVPLCGVEGVVDYPTGRYLSYCVCQSCRPVSPSLRLFVWLWWITKGAKAVICPSLSPV